MHVINNCYQNFSTMYNQTTRTMQSSTNKYDIMNRACQIYFWNKSSKFTFFQHRLILRHEQKWKYKRNRTTEVSTIYKNG